MATVAHADAVARSSFKIVEFKNVSPILDLCKSVFDSLHYSSCVFPHEAVSFLSAFPLYLQRKQTTRLLSPSAFIKTEWCSPLLQ